MIFLFALLSSLLFTEHPICGIGVYFSPYDDVEKVVSMELNMAQKSIHASLYGIDNKNLATILGVKSNQGVDVKIGEDKLQAAGPHDLHEALGPSGAKVIIKKTTALEHNKWAIIDGKTVLEGSWNWSRNAPKQDNSLLVLKDCPEIAKEFEAAFQRIIRRDSQ